MGAEGNVAYYRGVATQLGRVFAIWTFNPPGSTVFATYVKYAANGDMLVGKIVPDDASKPFTTGPIVLDGRFDGANGNAR